MPTSTLPAGPQAPKWLQKLHYTLKPLDYMTTARANYGDVFNAPVIGKHPAVLFISHPVGLQYLFASDNQKITSPSNQLLQPIVGDRSIFCLEGARHRRERKLLMPPFHRERMASYGQLIVALTHARMAQLQPGDPVLARSLAQDISLEVILRVVFGLTEGDRFATLKPLLVQFADCFQKPLVATALFFPALQKDWGPRSPWGYVQAVQRQMREVLTAEIRDRRQQDTADKPDILSLLMATRDEQGQPMTDAELYDELITLLLAGHETTASAIAWTLYCLHREPAIRTKLQAELATLGPHPDPLAIVQLPYLTAVCNETLRLYPIAILTVPREVREPLDLMGYHLEPGTRLYGCIYLTHRRPDLYPNPDQFNPDRFLDRQFTPYEFLPFGGGLRRCVGEALAQFELKLVVATLITHYRFSLASTTPEIPQRRGVTLAPSKGVPLLFEGKV